MKLVIITNYWINSNGGGIREYSKNLVTYLKHSGVDVVVIFREGEDPNNYRLPSNKFKFNREAIKILIKEKPDAILCQGGWFTLLPATKYKKKYKKVKIISIFHSDFDKRLSLFKRQLNNRLLNQFDQVGFVSKGLENNIRNVAGLDIKTKTYILYGSAEIELPSEEDIEKFRKSFKIESSNFYLLAMGLTAFHYKKEGAKLLIKSLKKVIITHPEVRLILTRKGKYSDELKDYVKSLDLNNYVILTGDVDNPFVPMTLADVYTHISYGDGLPISIFEAMSFGKPIIGSNISGIPEAITDKHDGILVNNEECEVREAIIKLIENKDLRMKYASEIKITMNRRFSWEKTAKHLINIIESEGK